jgi:hypothetical protein
MLSKISRSESWTDDIVAKFSDCICEIVIVFDPDQLLTDMRLSERIQALGYEIFDYSDNVALWYYLESCYFADSIDKRNKLLINISKRDCSEEYLPYHIVDQAAIISLRIEDIFENISPQVLSEIPNIYYDELYQSLFSNPPVKSSYDASRDYILRYIYNIDSNSVNSDLDLLRVLLRLHYKEMVLSNALGNRLIDLLHAKAKLPDWDLTILLYDAAAFYEFLQIQWVKFIKHKLKVVGTGSCEITINADDKDENIILFDHQDIRIYIDNLFEEGKLSRITVSGFDQKSLGWISCGISQTKKTDYQIVLEKLKNLEHHLPPDDSRFYQWQSYVKEYAELISLVFSDVNFPQPSEMDGFCCRANEQFLTWMNRHFASLVSLPASKPVMVHHIAKSMAFARETDFTDKVALLVIDGMSFDQWISIKKNIGISRKNYNYTESAVFAWVPTLTSISRQAIFSGKQPIYFGESINRTNKEPNLWKSFWEDNNVPFHQIAYFRDSGSNDALKLFESQIDLRQCKVLGLVVSMVDKIMHGMQLGSHGMHNQIIQWCQSGYLKNVINQLFDYGFTIWITSDHGNVECIGDGNLQEGVLAENRGSRVRIYQSQALRDNSAAMISSSQVWKPVGLPNDMYPLFSSYKRAFSAKGSKIVTHGGVSIEEVMVPLIKITGRINEKKPL